ncbi:LytR family transcriptional attenuator [Stackebrandtia endophytica]|uniref:LytR family transcriptional attenuator n=1 Tax=Stackebrandtia endophytica TaxID=1496996 RepID=A0A543AX65_9ACTN|nr:LCP family protein [Stackebrandtia endophytica]TQL77171.1 LytR family transcriptional attenuator [Stackebrandtia endophytica]
MAKHVRKVQRVPRWAILMSGVGAVVMLAVIATLGYTAFVRTAIDDALQEESLLPDIADSDADGITGPLNLLLVGADLRVDKHNAALADTIIILHINKNLDTATLISLPRDLLVDIPDCGPGPGGDPCQDKINAAYSFVGPEVSDSMSNLATTITNLTGVTFNGAAVVNFEGFMSTVEMFGGIELCLTEDLYTEHGSGFYPQGCNEYNPQDALSIVRERKNWPDGDYGRQRMQQHFIKQLLKRAEEEGYLSNPMKVTTLIEKMTGQIVYDLGPFDPVDFAVALRHVKPSKMDMVKLPSHPENINNVSYVVITPGTDEETRSEALFKAIRDDTLTEWIAGNPDYINTDPKTQTE